MRPKLFLVCPFSGIENFIRNRYGEDVFFLTSMGAVFQFQEKEYLQIVKEFIDRENIAEIFIVSDTSCRFINNALKHRLGYDSYSETVIQTLLKRNYTDVMKKESMAEQQIKLARLIINHQANEIMKHNLFEHQIIENKILIKGLITIKEINHVVELTFNTRRSINGISNFNFQSN